MYVQVCIYSVCTDVHRIVDKTWPRDSWRDIFRTNQFYIPRARPAISKIATPASYSIQRRASTPLLFPSLFFSLFSLISFILPSLSLRFLSIHWYRQRRVSFTQLSLFFFSVVDTSRARITDRTEPREINDFSGSFRLDRKGKRERERERERDARLHQERCYLEE